MTPEHIEQMTAAPGETRDVPAVTWEDIHLGTMSWDSSIGGYVLRITRRDDLPLSFDVWTKVGH